MLRLFEIVVYLLEDPSKEDSHFVLGYNECHAVNLVYRHYDSVGMLNDIRHAKVRELTVIHPSQFIKK